MNGLRFLLFLTVMFAIDTRGAEPSLVSSTIVIYNKAALDSAELARFYAKQRGIASDHIVGLTCSTDEEISREEYDSNIAEPLRETFLGRQRVEESIRVSFPFSRERLFEPWTVHERVPVGR